MNDLMDAERARARTRRKPTTFEAAETRTRLVRDLVDAENAATDAKTVKLRALRLAREEAERAEALANPAPVPVARKLRAAK
jgi:hypothetical protein